MMMMMMINNFLLPSSTYPHLISTTYKPPSPPLLPVNAQHGARNLHLGCRQASRRGISVVTRAGPSASSFIFAFVFPLSLIAITIVTSMRIADKLDQKFFEEFTTEQAIREAQDDDDDNENPNPSIRETTPSRSRNRPKREVESSSSK